MAVFDFNSLPGYRTCLQSGSTLRLDKEYREKFNIDKD